jgi:hypothetical protein
MAPATPISMMPPEGPASSPSASRRSTWPLAMALLRQPNNCEGDIPYRRAHRRDVHVRGQRLFHNPSLGLVQPIVSRHRRTVLHPARHDLEQLEPSITGHMRRHRNSHRHQATVPISQPSPLCQTGPPCRLLSQCGEAYCRFTIVDGACGAKRSGAGIAQLVERLIQLFGAGSLLRRGEIAILRGRPG